MRYLQSGSNSSAYISKRDAGHQITGGGRADIREPRVLPPIARTPAAIIGIGSVAPGGTVKSEPLNLMGRAASRARGDKTLEVIHLADVGGFVAHVLTGAIGHDLAAT